MCASVCSVEEKCISLQFPGLSQWISSFDFRLPLIHIASVIPNGHWLTLQYHYLLLCLNRPFCVFVSEIRWFPWLFCTNGLFMCQDDEDAGMAHLSHARSLSRLLFFKLRELLRFLWKRAVWHDFFTYYSLYTISPTGLPVNFVSCHIGRALERSIS